MGREVRQLLENQFGDEACRTQIAGSVGQAESPAYNKTVFEHFPNSRGAHDYDGPLDELLAAGFF